MSQNTHARAIWHPVSIVGIQAAILIGRSPACAADAATYIRYVNAEAVGGAEDGTSWANAYRTLQDALAEAAGDGANDYEIWVTEGVYYPDEGGGMTEDDRAASFRIYRDNIRLCGIANPSLTHVTFSGNEADRSEFLYEGGGGLYNSATYGGTSSPVLNHVSFADNQAGQCAGMTNRTSEAGSVATPTLTDVSFSRNQAHDAGCFTEATGGGLCNLSYLGSTSNPVLTRVSFTANQAQVGGGIYNWGNGSGSSSSPAVTNAVFSGNEAWDGGGIYNKNTGGTTRLVLTNLTFSLNTANKGGALYNRGAYGTSTPLLTNVILWGNPSPWGTQIFNEDATVTLNNSLVEGGEADISGDQDDTPFSDGTGNISADPQFIGGATGDLRLWRSSPAIDAGDNDAVPAGITTDLNGALRFVDRPTVVDTGRGTPPSWIWARTRLRAMRSGTRSICQSWYVRRWNATSVGQ